MPVEPHLRCSSTCWALCWHQKTTDELTSTSMSSKHKVMAFTTSPTGLPRPQICKIYFLISQLCSLWHQIGQTSPACPSGLLSLTEWCIALLPHHPTQIELKEGGKQEFPQIYQVYFTLLSCLIDPFYHRLITHRTNSYSWINPYTLSANERKHSYTGLQILFPIGWEWPLFQMAVISQQCITVLKVTSVESGKSDNKNWWITWEPRVHTNITYSHSSSERHFTISEHLLHARQMPALMELMFMCRKLSIQDVKKNSQWSVLGWKSPTGIARTVRLWAR